MHLCPGREPKPQRAQRSKQERVRLAAERTLDTLHTRNLCGGLWELFPTGRSPQGRVPAPGGMLFFLFLFLFLLWWPLGQGFQGA